VFETNVYAVFKDEEAMNVLSVFFKPHTAVMESNSILFVLYFPSPAEFKYYADIRAEETIAKWKSYDGSIS